MLNKHFWKGVFTWQTFKSYLLQFMKKVPYGIFIGCLVTGLSSLDNDIHIDWWLFWKVLPYVALGLILIGMFSVKGTKETRLTVAIIFLSGITLIPVDIHFNGVKAVLKFAGYGFAFGVLMAGIFFSVFEMHYVNRGFRKLTDNFTKDNVISAILFCIFTTLVGVYGHAIFSLWKFMPQ